MKIFECSKCNSKDVFVAQNGNNTGLYCADCGKWIKWLNKDELRLAERQIKSLDKVIRNKAIDEFAETIRDICHKYPIGNDADTNEPLYAHEDGTWHNLIDDVAEQMKGE